MWVGRSAPFSGILTMRSKYDVQIDFVFEIRASIIDDDNHSVQLIGLVIYTWNIISTNLQI